MILFLLLTGAKDFTIIVGGIFVSSIECFAMVINYSLCLNVCITCDISGQNKNKNDFDFS